MVAALANVIYSGPRENLDRRNEISAREGDVFCDVYKRTQAGITARHPKKLFQFHLPDPADEGAWFLLANVDCRIYTQKRVLVRRFRVGVQAIQATLR